MHTINGWKKGADLSGCVGTSLIRISDSLCLRSIGGYRPVVWSPQYSESSRNKPDNKVTLDFQEIASTCIAITLL